jgi:glycosyltransferase involved in cell wall biosynthesis
MNRPEASPGASGQAPGRRLVVGTWPGRSFHANEFARVFADALAAEGCTVIDVPDPARVREKLDVLHVHWPELVFWQKGGRLAKALYAFRAYRAIRRMKRRGTRLCWMVHNLRPHDLSGLRRRIWPRIERFMLRHTDGFMTLAPSTIDVVRQAHPALAARPAAAALHPVYPLLPDLPDRDGCRAELGLEPRMTVFALLGLLRPYKGAEALIDAFSRNPDPDNRLLIVGRPFTPEYGERIQALAAADPRITVNLDFLGDREFAVHLKAVDFVVLPYHSTLHSGALVHALSYGRVVIARAAPFANDVAEAVGRDWVICFPEALSPELFDGRAAPEGAADLAALQPSEMGRTAAAFYRRLIGSPAVD